MQNPAERSWVRQWMAIGIPLLLCPFLGLAISYLVVAARKGYEGDFATLMLLLAGLMLIPILVLEGVLGAFLYAKHRGRQRQAEWSEAILAGAEADVALPLTVQVIGRSPLPKAMTEWPRPEEFVGASAVRAVTVSNNGLLLTGPTQGRKLAPVARLSGGIMGHGLAVVLESLPLTLPLDAISRVQIAVGAPEAVVHVVYKLDPTGPLRVYSFSATQPSDHRALLAALRHAIPSEELVLPLPKSQAPAGPSETVCPYCGAQLHDELDYCLKCGKSKPTEARPAARNRGCRHPKGRDPSRQ